MADDYDQPADGFASSPCYAHETAMPLVPVDELLAWLNTLVEAERAGTRGLIVMRDACADARVRNVFDDIARDEARFCAMLSHHVTRLGGTPSRATGVFLDKLIARTSEEARLALVDRGQTAVVHMIDEMLPRIHDRDLRHDLVGMRDDHVRNLAIAAEAAASR